MLDVLREWLGDGGKPVDMLLAESRAKVCIECPLNVAPKWWEKALTHTVAIAIREMLEAKQGLNLKLPNEDKLSMCKICGCCTILKVLTPIEHILSQTEPDQLNGYPEHCWIKTETKV